MSHLIIKGIDVVYTPQGNKWERVWHNLQTPVANGIALDGSNTPFTQCPIVQCGLKPDFDAAICDVPADLRDEMNLGEFKLILADCRNGLSGKVHPLHVPKKGYAIHQNSKLRQCTVAAAQAVLGTDGFEIVTEFVLGGYSQYGLSIAIKGNDSFNVGTLANGANDSWDKFFNLNSSHNGLIASSRLLSTIRSVCFNAVLMSIADAENRGTRSIIKHTPNSEEFITPQIFEADLRQWIAQSDRFQALLAATKAQSMTVDEFKAFASGVFTNSASDELSTNSFNRVEDMVPVFQKGDGNTGSTRYDAINAFTQYFTSGNGTGNPKNVSANKRLAMANFGRGNDWKQDAIRVATDETLFADCVKRGTILYSDKSAVVNSAN